jgi:hypothetical protein
MSNMTEERIITVDEVQAAIDLEVSVLKKAIEMVVDALGNMSDHMNAEFKRQSGAIREVMEKHNGLGRLFMDFVDEMEKVLGRLDCIRPEE